MLLVLLLQQLLLMLHLMEVLLLLLMRMQMGVGVRGWRRRMADMQWRMVLETALVERGPLHVHVGLLGLLMLWHRRGSAALQDLGGVVWIPFLPLQVVLLLPLLLAWMSRTSRLLLMWRSPQPLP